MAIRIHLDVDAALREGETIALPEARVHYLRNVMRRSVGDRIRVFNHEAGEFDAEISALGKKAGDVTMGALRRAPRPAMTALHLLVAQVKRSPMETIIQKATELGVERIQPLITDRTNASGFNRDRCAAIALEAAEQCERLSVPAVLERRSLADMLDRDFDDPKMGVLFCDEAGDDETAPWGGDAGRAAPMLNAIRDMASPPSSAAVLIGPEGGFSPQERRRLRETPNVFPVSLGPRILRADTAVVAALTLWQAACGDWRAP
ncbi:MAG: 16S rRNA (uracil(1498)-N(3))-methyltransferase [Pseudomonadota bacterium]